MSDVLTACGIAVWFLLLFWPASRRLALARPPEDAGLALPLTLNAAFAFSLFVFNVPRQDGTAVLDAGLSASNVMTIAITAAGVAYIGVAVLIRRSVALLPFAAGYVPLTLMILYDALSTAWSVVPPYTAYRAVELATYFVLTLLAFDRADIERRLAGILSFYVAAWLVVAAPGVMSSLAGGTVFSAAKNNTMPLVCAASMLTAAFDRGAALRRSAFVLGLAGFVVAGSASSTGALLCAVPVACLAASPRRGLRTTGFVLGTIAVAGFAVLVVGLSAFPGLVDVLSAVLQKPAIELETATGRASFWPIFIAATRDHMFGSGYSAADRFIQLLVPSGALPDVYARDQINIGNSHNMYLSAWAATGVVGLCFAVAVLGTAVRRALRLPVEGRRLVLSVLMMLILNGMTTPGVFQDWSPMVFAFVAVLAYTRIGLLRAAAGTVPVERRRAPRPRTYPALVPSPAPLPGRR